MPSMTNDELRNAIGTGEVSALSLDTSIFDQYGSNLEFTLLVSLDQFRGKPVDVVFSHIVQQETIAHIAESAGDAQSALKRALKTQAKRWRTVIDPATLPAELRLGADPEDEAEAQFAAYAKTVEAQIIPACPTAEISDEVIRRYFSVETPFAKGKNKKAEFPDAFALLSLEDWARREGKKILCVSKDKGWQTFAEQSDHLVCVADLNDALAAFNEMDVTVVDEVVALLKAGGAKYLAEEIEDALQYEIEGSSAYPEGDSPFFYEAEFVGGGVQNVYFDQIEDVQVTALYEEDVSFSMKLKASVEYEAAFSFSVKDGIDKDYVSLGTEHFDTEKTIDFEVVITMPRVFEEETEPLSVEARSNVSVIDFGSVDPFQDEDPTFEKY